MDFDIYKGGQMKWRYKKPCEKCLVQVTCITKTTYCDPYSEDFYTMPECKELEKHIRFRRKFNEWITVIISWCVAVVAIYFFS